MISTDSPIRKKGKADVLKRAPLALKVAQIIKGYKGKESYVIGIEGIWGAGKTSFINLILENFSTNSVVVKFNPWNFSSQNELIADFFDSFVSGLHEKSEDDEIRKTLAGYTTKLLKQTELEFSPSLSFMGFQLTPGKIKKFGGTPTLSEMRKKIDALLSKRNKKILVVIDDIDRLDKQETLLILKMVKMTANFPNTVFLLAYDREKVADRITEEGISGEDYLKKIVQVSFTLPVPDKQNLRSVLFNGLNTVIDSIYGSYTFNKEEQKHWESVFHHGFGDLFTTIRDINRFLSSLQLNWSAVNKEDVNPVDFIAIEALRVFTPTYYNVIAGNKSLFLNIADSIFYTPTSEDDEKREKIYQSLLDDVKIVPKNLKKQVDGISRELFPQLDVRISRGNSDSQREWRREQRICAEQKFDFYFQLSVPEDEVSEVEVQAILSETIDQNSLKQRFLALDKEKKLTKAIDLILDRREEIKEAQAESLLTCLWSIDGQVEDKRTGLFDLSDFSTIVGRLTYQLVAYALPKEKREDFIHRVFRNGSNAHFPLRLLDVFEEQIEKNDTSLPVEKSFVTTFRAEILELIKKKAKDGTLANETRFDVALFRWAKWEDKETVKKYIEALIKSNKGLIQFLEGFTGRIYSSNEGEYRSIGIKSMGELYPIEEIRSRVNKFKKQKSKKMSSEERELINLFENPPKDW